MRAPPAWVVGPMLRARNALARTYRGIVPPEVRVLETTFGIVETNALATAAELRVADELATGPVTVDELARRCEADADALGRLLRLLASLGYFRRDDDGRWRNNPASALLASGTTGSLRSWVRFMGSDWAQEIWGLLPASARTGGSGTEARFGTDFFGFLRERPDASELFDAAMADVSRLTGPFVASGLDLTGVRSVCDVGGGTGTVLASVLAEHPHLRGTLYDLPEVVAGAAEVLASAGVAGRVDVEAGSFFDRVPPGHDRYLLQSIVHDWDDASCVTILGHVRDAMPAGARVVLLESIVPDGPMLHPAKYSDLMMLVLTGRGRERSRAGYERLAAHAGLRVDRVVDLVMRDAIELVAADRPGG